MEASFPELFEGGPEISYLPFSARINPKERNLMADRRRLNIIDEAGNIIGETLARTFISTDYSIRKSMSGLYPNQEIIFQHRAKDKDTYPDLLDATVGGHVEIGDSYESTALKEIEEETGVKASLDNLTFIQVTKTKSYDQVSKASNHALRAVYAFRYDGKLEDLRVEKGKAIGFEAWSLEKLFNISEDDKKRFISTIFKKENLAIFKKIQNL